MQATQYTFTILKSCSTNERYLFYNGAKIIDWYLVELSMRFFGHLFWNLEGTMQMHICSYAAHVQRLLSYIIWIKLEGYLWWLSRMYCAAANLKYYCSIQATNPVSGEKGELSFPSIFNPIYLPIVKHITCFKHRFIFVAIRAPEQHQFPVSSGYIRSTDKRIRLTEHIKRVPPPELSARNWRHSKQKN